MQRGFCTYMHLILILSETFVSSLTVSMGIIHDGIVYTYTLG